MLARHHLFAFSLSLLGAVACATGGELPVEDERTPLVAAEEDAGLEASTIRPSSSTPTPPAQTSDAAAADTGTSTPDAAVADTAPPPPPPPPPPTTAACPMNGNNAALVFALVIAGVPADCTGGTCGSGECCYNMQYCLPE